MIQSSSKLVLNLTWMKNTCQCNANVIIWPGVYISFINPSLLLKSFLFMKNKYITFLNYVHFLLFWKLVHYLLKICTFLSLFKRRVHSQIKYTSFLYFKKDNFEIYVHFFLFSWEGSLFKYITLPSYDLIRTTWKFMYNSFLFQLFWILEAYLFILRS